MLIRAFDELFVLLHIACASFGVVVTANYKYMHLFCVCGVDGGVDMSKTMSVIQETLCFVSEGYNRAYS